MYQRDDENLRLCSECRFLRMMGSPSGVTSWCTKWRNVVDGSPMPCSEARGYGTLYCGVNGREWQIEEAMTPPHIESVPLSEAQRIFDEARKSNE